MDRNRSYFTDAARRIADISELNTELPCNKDSFGRFPFLVVSLAIQREGEEEDPLGIVL